MTEHYSRPIREDDDLVPELRKFELIIFKSVEDHDKPAAEKIVHAIRDDGTDIVARFDSLTASDRVIGLARSAQRSM